MQHCPKVTKGYNYNKGRVTPVYINVELHAKLKVSAAEKRTTLTALSNEILQSAIGGEESNLRDPAARKLVVMVCEALDLPSTTPAYKVLDYLKAFVETHKSMQEAYDKICEELVEATDPGGLIPLSEEGDVETIVHQWGCTCRCKENEETVKTGKHVEGCPCTCVADRNARHAAQESTC